VNFAPPFYTKMKASITEPIIQANKIAIIAVVVAVLALAVAFGSFYHAV
jgi:hypothetical protein